MEETSINKTEETILTKEEINQKYTLVLAHLGKALTEWEGKKALYGQQLEEIHKLATKIKGEEDGKSESN